MTDGKSTPPPVDPRLDEAKALLAEAQYAQSSALFAALLSLPDQDAAGELAEAFAAVLIDAAEEPPQALLSALFQQPEAARHGIVAVAQLGELSLALQLATRLCEVDPADARAALLRGWLLLRDDQFEAALKVADQVNAAEPENLESLALKIETRIAQGDRAFANGDGDKANAAYRLALSDNDSLLAKSPETPSVYLNRAQIHTRLNDTDAAIGDYGHALERDPDYVEARMGRARTQFMREHSDAAFADTARVLEIDPENVEALALRADIRAAQGDDAASEESADDAEQAWHTALADYDTLTARLPDVATVFLSRARTRRKLDDIDGALADFGRAVELDPELAAAYGERGLIHEFRGDYELALADYQEFVRLVPDEPEGYRNRGDCLLALGRFDDALKSYGQARRQAPGFLEAHLGHARAQAAVGRWEAAIADVEQALTTDPESLEALALRADIRAAQGDQVASDGAESQAEEAWRIALADYDTLAERASDAATVFSSRAQTRRKLGEIEGALADFDQAIKLSPDSAAAHNERGLLYEVNANYEQALADYAEVVRLAPDDPAGFRNKADALFALGRFDEAAVDYGHALELLPDFVDALLGRCRTYMALQQLDEALEDVEQVLAIDAENLEAMGQQAGIWAARGDSAAAAMDSQSAQSAYEKAIAVCDDAVALAPDNAVIIITRAWYQARVGRLEQTLADCKKAIALDPAMEDDAVVLKELIDEARGQHTGSVEEYQRVKLQGLIQEALGNEEAARQDFERVMKLAPELADGYLLRGNLRLNREQFQMAVWDFNRALDRSADSAESYLGRAYSFLGLYYGYSDNGLYVKAHESACTTAGD
jgi:tetratricopeptide (TPR) repeat protein